MIVKIFYGFFEEGGTFAISMNLKFDHSWHFFENKTDSSAKTWILAAEQARSTFGQIFFQKNLKIMTYSAKTPAEYLEQIPLDRVPFVNKLREAVLENLPEGFEEMMNYGQIGYVVPKTIYPKGYHCDPKLPLPFAGIASQKNSINFYHMGIYSDPELLEWFRSEWPKHTKMKLDMGKSCIRLAKFEEIPFALFGELMQKISTESWIEMYETAFRLK